MLVKCIAVPKERTPKKVEVTLSRIAPVSRNVIKLNVRVADVSAEEYIVDEDIIATEDIPSDDESDNLIGIVPVVEFHSADADVPLEEAEEDVATLSISEIDADLEELENDLISQISNLEEDEASAPHQRYDDSIVQRHFVRDDTGELYESDSETAEGHEVACYDNSGKLMRACGVIRKGQPAALPVEDDGFSQAVSDMFSDSDN